MCKFIPITQITSKSKTSGWYFVRWGFVRLGFCPLGFCPLGFCPRTGQTWGQIHFNNRKQRQETVTEIRTHYSDSVSGLTSSEVYHKTLFLTLFFSMFLLMIFFTFWINPLSTIMLMITPSYAHSNADTLIHTLQQDCTSTLQWFNINQMKANPSKFQAISFGKRGTRDIKINYF